MKRRTVYCLILLAISLVCFFGYKQYEKLTEDRTPPVLSCESDTLEVSVSVTEEELLAGVTALDDVSGDVTDSVVIEDISDFIKENTRIITYVASDDNRNVGRIQRTLIYTDYKEPVFSLTGPLSYVVGTRVNILGNIRAASTLDGDMTTKIRYGLDGVIDNLVPGKYPVEYRVTDSCGKTTYFNTEIEIFDSAYSGIKVELKKYLVYVDKGKKFNPDSYFKGSNIEGELSVVSNVNTKAEGVYHVDYYVSGVNASGKSRLVVIVK
ncbi:MAG: hypothetical protein E7563_00450 [Ruminococcaceae bacterium]|nr:hypothetical protein [Oscillospiraceae bacterium]